MIIGTLQDLWAAQRAAFYSADLFGEAVLYRPKGKQARPITVNVHRQGWTNDWDQANGELQIFRAMISCATADLEGDETDWYGDQFEFDGLVWTLAEKPQMTTAKMDADLMLQSVKQRTIGTAYKRKMR